VKRSSISPTRLASALALGAWAGLLWYLKLSGRGSLYLSPRVSWVIPVGAVFLTLATLGRLSSLRTAQLEPLKTRAALGIVVIVLPALTIMMLPRATLGSYAANRRTALNGAVSQERIRSEITKQKQQAKGSPTRRGIEISLVYVAAASRSAESREALQGLVDAVGSAVTFEGFVNRKKGLAPGEFLLTRFIISCCLADAVSAEVRVTGAQETFKKDQWVRVSGDIELPAGNEVVVHASSVVKIPQPEQPYLLSI